MKAVICFLAVIGMVIAQSEKPGPAPIPLARASQFQRTSDGDAYILRFDNNQDNLHSYKFGFETSNGISRDEQGTLTNPGTEAEAMEVVGGYEYIDPLNRKVTVTYTAGVNGFVPIITYS